MKKFILLVLLTLSMSFTQQTFAQEVKPDEKTEFSLPQEEMDYIKTIIEWHAFKKVKGEPDGLTEEQSRRASYLCGDAGQQSGYLCYFYGGSYYTVYYAWMPFPGIGNVLHHHTASISTESCCQ